MNSRWKESIRWGAAAGLLLAAGCVSRAEYDRVEFARRNAQEQLEAKERELADERAQRGIVEADRNAARRENNTMSAMAANLRAENQRLDATQRKTQGLLDDALKASLREPPVIEITKLPPVLDKALREFAQRHPDVAEYLADKGMVRWKSDLTFDLGSDVVKPEANSALCDFANILNNAGAAFEVVIVGHTDNVPVRASNKAHRDNWDLSCHRAMAVKDVFKRCGVSESRIGCMGYGEHRPRVPNQSRSGEPKNRRVEVFLVASKDSMGGGG